MDALNSKLLPPVPELSVHPVELLDLPMARWSPQGQMRWCNATFAAWAGRSVQALAGLDAAAIFGTDNWALESPALTGALGGQVAQFTRLGRLNPAGPRWLRTLCMPDIDHAGQVIGVRTLTMDVHEQVLEQEQLRHRAERDDLTGAYSRSTMMDRIEAGTARAARRPVALFFIDLDGFKQVNDALGHAQGDALLQTVAAALMAGVRGDDAVGRFGGDEFLVLAQVRDAAGAERLATHLLEAVHAGSRGVDGQPQATASIGWAMAPQDATQPLRLIQLADDAMYAAKRNGRARVMRATVEMMRAAD
ncbi:MAG: GGDEF domain-containing protein [Aquabacterium sp.]